MTTAFGSTAVATTSEVVFLVFFLFLFFGFSFSVFLGLASAHAFVAANAAAR